MDYVRSYTHLSHPTIIYQPTIAEKKLFFTSIVLYKSMGIESHINIEGRQIRLVSESFGKCSLGISYSPGMTLPDLNKRAIIRSLRNKASKQAEIESKKSELGTANNLNPLERERILEDELTELDLN